MKRKKLERLLADRKREIGLSYEQIDRIADLLDEEEKRELAEADRAFEELIHGDNYTDKHLG